MNQWTEKSVHIASNNHYLDDLFDIYPTVPGGRRDIPRSTWARIEHAYLQHNNLLLISELLKLDLFPLKDSYVAYLKKDRTALQRNPATVNRLCKRLYEMNLEDIFDRCTDPKETNRQIGPLFQNWVKRATLSYPVVSEDVFNSTTKDAILEGSDSSLGTYARIYLGYYREKGLDFVGRFNNQLVIGEAKFLTDFGGHQAAQFEDAISTIHASVNAGVVQIAILDGVLYIPRKTKMFRYLVDNPSDLIMSALVLREFLNSL